MGILTSAFDLLKPHKKKSTKNLTMAPPTPLAIATSSLQRLVKEELSYEDENAEYKLNQERAAIQETKNVFPPLRERIKDALQKLEDQVEEGQSNRASEEEISKAKDIIKSTKEAASQ